MEDVGAEAHRLSRCLSQASFPPPADRDMREDQTNKKVTDAFCFILYSETLVLIQLLSSSFKKVERFSISEVVFTFIIWWLKWECGAKSLPRVQVSEE